jgi:hypothetical protein
MYATPENSSACRNVWRSELPNLMKTYKKLWYDKKIPKLNFIKFVILQEWKVDYQHEDMAAITVLLLWR